jgi:ATP-dependent DNA helicase RecG
MNVIKDVTFEGRILDQIEKAVAYLETQVKEHSYLGEDGKFRTDREYPKFVIQEMVVNSVCHRDYSIKGTEIQVKMFDNRMVFETPGKLPGIVRTDNIRHTHFSRNPKIAEYLKAYDYVKEFGEGVDRMCRELTAHGTPEPQYTLVAFIMKATVIATPIAEDQGEQGHKKGTKGHKKGTKRAQKGHEIILTAIEENPFVTISSLAEQCELSLKAVRGLLNQMKSEGIIHRIGPNNGGHWEIVKRL